MVGECRSVDLDWVVRGGAHGQAAEREELQAKIAQAEADKASVALRHQQAEAGWENTLTGIPKEIYEFWKRRLQPEGYHIRYEVIDYPGGMPGDVSITLSCR